MNWIKTGIFSLIGGAVIGFAVDLAFLTTGDCGIGALAGAIVFAVPVGNILGITVYRKFFLKSFTKADIASGILGLILAAIAALAGLYAMDVIGSMPGLFVAILGPCLGSMLGYTLGLRIARRRK
jgi:hypothetical protein